MIRTTKYFDSSSSQAPLPPTIYRKPVRIVKAVQRPPPSPLSDSKSSSFTKMNSDIIYNENDSNSSLKAFTSHYPDNHSLNELTMKNERHLSTEYTRDLFPIPDSLRRNRSRQNSATINNNDIRTVSNDNVRQAVREK
jgi:hypothetical protein